MSSVPAPAGAASVPNDSFHEQLPIYIERPHFDPRAGWRRFLSRSLRSLRRILPAAFLRSPVNDARHDANAAVTHSGSDVDQMLTDVDLQKCASLTRVATKSESRSRGMQIAHGTQRKMLTNVDIRNSRACRPQSWPGSATPRPPLRDRPAYRMLPCCSA
jgi:hypothetical protein